MTVLTSNKKATPNHTKSDSSGAVRLNVTGVDVKGQMFRHPATVLMLDGHDCVFRSESQPELDGSILAEFDYEGANPQLRVSQGRVRSNAVDTQTGQCTVVVDMEFAQSAKVNLKEAESLPGVLKPEPRPAVPVVQTQIENKIAPLPIPAPTLPEFSLPSIKNDTVQGQAFDVTDEAASKNEENIIPMPAAMPADTATIQDAIQSALASKLQSGISMLKQSIANEVEKALPSIVTSKMEEMIREEVEKLVQSNYEMKLRGLDATMEEETNSRSAMIQRSFEESLAEMEAKMNASRAEMASAMAAMQNMRQEMNEGILQVQAAIQQLKDAEKPGIEQMQNRAAIQLREWSGQFDNLLNKSATEKAIQFSLDMERRMAPHRQRADETVEKLGAMLQLLQNTARGQQEHMNEYSLLAVARLEKEIKAFLIRLGGGA